MDTDSNNPHVEEKTRAIVFALLFANFFRNLGISIIEIGLPDFVLSLAGTLTSYGIIIGVFSITQSIFQLPMGRAADQHGRKMLILLGIFIYIIGTFLCYLAQDILQLILFRAIQGAGAYSSILQAMIGDFYKKEDEHGKGMALFSVSMTFGYFGGIIIGGYISSYLGFRMIFLFSTILGIISAILAILFIKDHRKIGKKFNNEEGTNSPIEKIKKKELIILVKDKEFNVIVLLNSLRWFLFSGVYVLFIWQIQVNFGLTQIEATIFIMILVAIYMFFIMFGGYLSDNYGIKKILLYSQLIIIIIGLLVFVSTAFFIFIIIGVFIGIGFALFQTSGYALLAKYIENNYPELKGSAFGFNNAIGFLLGAFGPIFICYLGDISDFLPYYFISLSIFFTYLISVLFFRQVDTKGTQKSSLPPLKGV
ncbi:MAG: MFS transporter [Promethearchaeota archaeon]|nr:MAG: MFS transporter [Candidatus Lokiarchaeota archaeon]